MKVFFIFIILFSLSCSSESPVKEKELGVLGTECKENFICDENLVCKNNKCISEQEACKYITCSGNDGNSHGQCFAKDSKVICECDVGSYLESNTKCILYPSCNQNSCSKRGSCEEVNNEIICDCDEGFEGDNCGFNIDDCVGNPCLANGICVDGVNSYTCNCNSGYENFGNNCLKVELKEVDLGSKYDEGISIAMDSDKNIYIVGETLNGKLGLILIKFNSSLQKLWELEWENDSHISSSSDLLAINSLNKIYVSGDNKKVYDTAGNSLGSYPGNNASIVIDNDDNIISLGKWGDIEKISAEHNHIWSSEDIPSGTRNVAVDINNNIYLLADDMGGHNSLNLIKFNSNGEKQWDKLFGTDKQEFLTDIFIGNNDNIYIAGTTSGSISGYENQGGMSDAIIMKISNDGNIVWEQQYGSSGQDIISSIAQDSLGNIYAVGNTNGRITEGVDIKGRNLFLVKINTNGEKEWIREWYISDANTGNSIIIDKDDNLYITGSTGDLVSGSFLVSKNLILLKITLNK